MNYNQGDKVTYIPKKGGKKQIGIVRSFNDHGIFVVYDCLGDWDNYMKYTAAMTRPEDLVLGWIEQKELISN